MMKTVGIAITIPGTALFAGAPVGAAERYAPQELADDAAATKTNEVAK
jgi:hypothetical protein